MLSPLSASEVKELRSSPCSELETNSDRDSLCRPTSSVENLSVRGSRIIQPQLAIPVVGDLNHVQLGIGRVETGKVVLALEFESPKVPLARSSPPRSGVFKEALLLIPPPSPSFPADSERRTLPAASRRVRTPRPTLSFMPMLRPIANS
jgi:hypothetical protein